jgi:hypothetical protein
MATEPMPTPALKDPVVVDALKYRIREITPEGTAVLRTSFGNLWSSIPLEWLVWDAVAGVWRPRRSAHRSATSGPYRSTESARPGT